MDRRTFLKAGAASLVASGTSAYAQDLADRKYRVGLIGCGWYGKMDLFRLIQVAPVEVVSLCDVDRNMLADAAKTVATRQISKRTPRTYGDYRQMLKERDLDIVLVATPDHWHALPMIAAVEAGAHVYVQKPISVDVAEGKAMVAAARKTGKTVQVGTQRRSTPHIVEAKDTIIKEGRLGKVGHVEVYCYYQMRRTQNPPDTAPPDYLDYEMWTGPAPMRPYNALTHPGSWRSFTEYGNGIMGDMCIHMLDMVRWLLDLGWPRRISSAGGILVQKSAKANIPDTQTATFEFPEFNVAWTQRSYGPPVDPEYPWGATIYGERGTLKLSVHKFDFLPNDKSKPVARKCLIVDKYPEDRTEPRLELHVAEPNRRHQQDFLRAIANKTRPIADIEQGYISSASCIMANLSMRLGRTLTWDSAKQVVVGDEEANGLLKRPYRKPWVHPG